LKALKRADELDGIVTDVERLKARKTDEEREYRPMFVIAGADLHFTTPM
jgi:hypothetical protein